MEKCSKCKKAEGNIITETNGIKLVLCDDCMNKLVKLLEK